MWFDIGVFKFKVLYDESKTMTKIKELKLKTEIFQIELQNNADYL